MTEPSQDASRAVATIDATNTQHDACRYGELPKHDAVQWNAER